MKKTILLFFAVVTMVFTACKPTPEPEFSYNFNSVIAEDYDMISTDKDSVYFYESHVVFDTDMIGKGSKVMSIENVFQYLDSCFIVKHEITNNHDSIVIDTVNDFWLECMNMNSRPTITLDSAINIVLASEFEIPNSNKMTYRRPLGPDWPENAFYIFGDHYTGFLKVDSETGEVAMVNEITTKE